MSRQIDFSRCGVDELRRHLWVPCNYSRCHVCIARRATRRTDPSKQVIAQICWNSLSVKMLCNPNDDVFDFLVENGAARAWRVNGGVDFLVTIVQSNPNHNIFKKALKLFKWSEMRDVHKRNLFWHAGMRREPEFCKELLDNGLDEDETRQLLGIALSRAVKSLRAATVEFLLSRGANPNEIDGDGRAPIHKLGCSFVQANRDTLDVLLRFGADVNACDKHGSTAIRNAFYWADVELFYVLLNAGADWDTERTNFSSLWDSFHAWHFKHYQMFGLLYMSGGFEWTGDFERTVATFAPRDRWFLWLLAIDSLPDRREDMPDCMRSVLNIFYSECAHVIRRLTPRLIAVCGALQTLRLPSLVLCEILRAEFNSWPRLRFCDLWNRVVCVRHFHDRRRKQER